MVLVALVAGEVVEVDQLVVVQSLYTIHGILTRNNGQKRRLDQIFDFDFL